MDKINKALLKIPGKQRKAVLAAAQAARKGDFRNLDAKKLKGSSDLFRIRVGKYRIILKARAGKNPTVVDVSKRDEKTYKDL